MSTNFYIFLFLIVSIFIFPIIFYVLSKMEKESEENNNDLPSDEKIDDDHLSKLDKIIPKRRNDVRKNIFLGDSVKSDKNDLYNKLNKILDIEIESRYHGSNENMILKAFVVKEDYHHERAIEIKIGMVKNNEDLSYRVYQLQANENGVEISLDTTLFFTQKEIDVIFTIIRDRYYKIIEDLTVVRNKKHKEELDRLNKEREVFGLTDTLE